MKGKFYNLLDFYFEPIKWLIRRHPKAAKKRRVLKKWMNRWGVDRPLVHQVAERLRSTDDSWLPSSVSDAYSEEYVLPLH